MACFLAVRTPRNVILLHLWIRATGSIGFNGATGLTLADKEDLVVTLRIEFIGIQVELIEKGSSVIRIDDIDTALETETFVSNRSLRLWSNWESCRSLSQSFAHTAQIFPSGWQLSHDQLSIVSAEVFSREIHLMGFG